MGARYEQRKDGESFIIPTETVYRLACCDCGLVHDVVIVSRGGRGKKVAMVARRNNRSTAQRRRQNRHLRPQS